MGRCHLVVLASKTCWWRSALLIVQPETLLRWHRQGVRHPTDAWAAQHLREATPCGTAPRFLIHDNDATYGPQCERVATATGVDVLTTPYQAPRANTLCERFIGSVRRECLDHLLILHERHLTRVLRSYVAYLNRERPHQEIDQAIPAPVVASQPIG